MCDRVIQKGMVIKPKGKLKVRRKRPLTIQGEQAIREEDQPMEGVFAGAARSESRNYWIRREGAEEVLVPDVQGFGERNKLTGQQNWQNLPEGSCLEGLLLPRPEGKDYRLLKILTQAATEEEILRLGNDRVPVVHGPAVPAPVWHRPDDDYMEFPPTGEMVWVSDGARVFRGRWTEPDISAPITEGKWENEAGEAVAASRWAFLSDSPDRVPAVPLPHPGFKHLQES